MITVRYAFHCICWSAHQRDHIYNAVIPGPWAFPFETKTAQPISTNTTRCSTACQLGAALGLLGTQPVLDLAPLARRKEIQTQFTMQCVNRFIRFQFAANRIQKVYQYLQYIWQNHAESIFTDPDPGSLLVTYL